MQPPTVAVRPAVDADVPAIAAVHVRSWQGGYRGILSDEFLAGLDPDRRVPGWRDILAAADLPRAGTLVAEADGTLLGFVHFAASRDDDAAPSTAEVTSIYVHPDAWSTGAGRALMSAALDAMRAAGYAGATLWVLDGNARAARFYRAAGWEPDGSTKQETIAGQPVPEVRYRHPLTH